MQMKHLFHIYQWCIAGPIMLVLTIVTSLITAIGSLLGGKRWFGYYPPMMWARCWCWLMFVKVRVVGREHIDPKANYVFVANHQGAYDIFVIYGFLRHNFRWMMRKGLSNIPMVGQACRMCGHIMVDHRNPKAIRKTMSDAERTIARGMSLVVFPEGRRTDTGQMGQFKSGAFRLAAEFSMPVVPITIDGSFDVMPRSTFNINPGTITVTLHQPIATTPQTDLRALARQCQETIARALPASQAQPGKQ